MTLEILPYLNTRFGEEVESLLSKLAINHVPQGSHTSALLDQWLHAIATDSQFFCDPSIISPKTLKTQVVSILQMNGLYSTREQFFSIVFGHLALAPDINPKFRFIDLFAGIGGLRLGFQYEGGACVFSSEFDKHAQKAYKDNHGEMPFGDITLIPPKHIPEHDVLLAGFPCQPFSHAGLKGGIDDTRGTLFYNIAQILKEKQPRFAVLENVRGLISHDKGHTLKIILKTLIEMGYHCNIPHAVIADGTAKEIQSYARKMVLRSRDFGIPQNRQRIFIVLWKDNKIKSFEYPAPLKTPTRIGNILEENPDENLTISDRLWAGHQRRKINNRRNGKGFGYGIVTPDSKYTNTISARYYKDGSEVLIDQSHIDEDLNPRKLSPREAARLQGFPDEFVLNQSNTQAYKQFGNSVTVPVVHELAKQLTPLLQKK